MGWRTVNLGLGLTVMLVAGGIAWLLLGRSGEQPMEGGERVPAVGSGGALDVDGYLAPGAGEEAGAVSARSPVPVESALTGRADPARPGPEAAGGEGGRGAGAAGPAAVDGGSKSPEQAAEEAEQERLRAVRCSLSGTVRVEGEPRAGVALVLASWHGPKFAQRGVSGPGGAFRFEDLRISAWSLSAVQPGLFGKGVKVECQENGQELGADLELAPAEVHVTGRVTDADGNPLDRTVLEVARQTSHQDLYDRLLLPVRPDGRFELWLPRDAQGYNVTVEAPGHLGQIKSVPTDRDQVELVFLLLRQSMISGLVLGPDGPRAGCVVHVLLNNLDQTAVVSSVEADEQGRFTLETGPGRVQLAAWDAKVGWASMELPARQETDDVNDVVLRLQPGKTITGVIQLQDGKPVPLGRVHFYCQPTPISEVVQADLQGAFAVPNLPPADRVHLQAWDDARPWRERGIDLEPSQTQATVILVPAPDGQEAP